MDDPSWEPDGVTLYVRFYEGPGTNLCMVELLWHRRQTRRQQRTPTSTCSTGRTRPTHQIRWAIAEGYIPSSSTGGGDRGFVSHETACLLNTMERDASVTITVYFSDRQPADPTG